MSVDRGRLDRERPPKTTKATRRRGLLMTPASDGALDAARPPRTSATGSIRGRTPGGPASDGTARSFPCRRPSSWSWFPRARGRRRAARRARRALGLAALAALRLVLEILVGEEQLLAGRPDERGPAVHAVQGLVLELHRYLSHSPLRSRHPDGMPGPGVGRPVRGLSSATSPTSRRCFLRVRLRASACLARRRSPGFR